MNGLNDGQERHVKAQDLVFGMVCNPSDLIGVQAGVDGVQHMPTATHPEIKLQVPMTIPGQGRDTVTEGQGFFAQRVGHLSGSAGYRGPVAAMNITLNAARNDFSVPMLFSGEFNQG